MTLCHRRILAAVFFTACLAVPTVFVGCGQKPTSDSPPVANIKADRNSETTDNADSTGKVSPNGDHGGDVVIHAYGDDRSAPAQGGQATANAKTSNRKSEKELDLTKMPEGGADELLAHLRKLAAVQPEENTREARAKFVQVQRAVIRVADKLLAEKDLPEDSRLEGINEKWTAHSALVQLDEPGAEEEFFKLTGELVKDKNAKVAKVARMVLRQREISLSLRALMQGKTERTAKLLEDLQAVLGEEDLGVSEFQLVQQAGMILESNEMYEAAAKVYAAMKQAFESATDPEMRATAVDIAEKGVRRLGLLGKKAELVGTQLDGKPYDVAEHKGKVVLVDFWATWCGPCKEELPNVVENYAKYHDRGFEVVGISLDESKDELDAFVAGENPMAKKLPWITVWASMPAGKEGESPFDHPLPTRFGVNGIPATYLIDQEGKVVALEFPRTAARQKAGRASRRAG